MSCLRIENRAVIANRADSEDGRPRVFRSYETYDGSQRSAKPSAAVVLPLWQVARATSAARTYLSSITIEDKSYVDGGFGTNNPAFEAFCELRTAQKGFARKESLLRPLVINIGSGQSTQTQRFAGSNLDFILSAIVRLTTQTQNVHKKLMDAAQRSELDYFRFTVDPWLKGISLDTWKVKKPGGKTIYKTLEHIEKECTRYLKQEDVHVELRRCAQMIVERCSSGSGVMQSKPAVPTINSGFNVPQSKPAISTIPFGQDHDFVGREDILNKLHEMFGFQNRLALVGMGGVG